MKQPHKWCPVLWSRWSSVQSQPTWCERQCCIQTWQKGSPPAFAQSCIPPRSLEYRSQNQPTPKHNNYIIFWTIFKGNFVPCFRCHQPPSQWHSCSSWPACTLAPAWWVACWIWLLCSPWSRSPCTQPRTSCRERKSSSFYIQPRQLAEKWDKENVTLWNRICE